MTLVTVVSAKGSPGATTVAALLALEFARRRADRLPAAFLVDADPDGGDLSLFLGLDPLPGAATLALAGRHGCDEALLLAHSQRSRALPGVAIVPGVAGRAQRAVLDCLAGPLAEAAAAMSIPVVVDAGRASAIATTRALFEASDCVLVACRSWTASIVHSRSALVSLTSEGIDAKAVVTGETGDHPDEIARALGHPVAAVVPLGPSTITSHSQSSRRLPSQGYWPAPRWSEVAVRALASVVLGELSPLAMPDSAILEVPPNAVISAALHARTGETTI